MGISVRILFLRKKRGWILESPGWLCHGADQSPLMTGVDKVNVPSFLSHCCVSRLCLLAVLASLGPFSVLHVEKVPRALPHREKLKNQNRSMYKHFRPGSYKSCLHACASHLSVIMGHRLLW